MKTYQETFQAIAYEQPSSGLEERIFLAIEHEDSSARQRKLMWSKLGLVFSFVAFVSAGAFYGQAFLASSFWNMLMLAFSDAQVVVLHWNEFLLSLVEMFPLQSVMFLLVPSFMLLLFLNMYFSVAKEQHFHHAHHGRARFA